MARRQDQCCYEADRIRNHHRITNQTGVDGVWESRIVEFEDWWRVVFASHGVVKGNCICLFIPTDGNAMHGLALCHTRLLTTLGIDRKITNRKQIKPCLGVGLGVVHQLEWRGEFLAKSSRDLIEHVSSMLYGIKPILSSDLFLSDERAGHANQCLPSALDQTITGLMASRCGPYFAALFIDPTERLTTNKFLVEVSMILRGYPAGRDTVFEESVNNIIGR